MTGRVSGSLSSLKDAPCHVRGAITRKEFLCGHKRCIPVSAALDVVYVSDVVL